MKEHDATEIAFKNGYEKGKADGAREIFAEIYRTHEDCIVILGDMGYFQPSKFVQKITELKKKYTEREKDNG